MNGRGGPPMKGGGIMPPRGGPPIIIGGPPMKPPGGGICAHTQHMQRGTEEICERLPAPQSIVKAQAAATRPAQRSTAATQPQHSTAMRQAQASICHNCSVGLTPPRERWKSAICCSITSWPSPDPSNCKKYDFTFDLCL